MTRENLINAQMSDSTLAGLRHIAFSENKEGKNPSIFYRDGVLMKPYHPPNLPDTDTWSAVHQVVLPTTVREAVIGLAHDGLAGHLGEKKTYRRLLGDYFWPGMKKQVQKVEHRCVRNFKDLFPFNKNFRKFLIY